MSFDIHRLGPDDLPLLGRLNALFGEVFGEPETYTGKPADGDYLQRLLGSDSFVALAALSGEEVVGGLVAYEFPKFEQQRSEFYLYDLAVAAAHRRLGIATALIGRMREIASERGAWVMYIQADTGPEDAAAIALYHRFSDPQRVLHFEIPVLDEDG